METFIKDAICSALLTAGRISRHQYAFIIKHSTVTNLLEATYDWTISLNSNNPVDAIYSDLQKYSTQLFTQSYSIYFLLLVYLHY